MSAFINVRTKEFRDIDTYIPPKLVWKGLVEHVPRVGDHIEIAEGFALELVLAVQSTLWMGTVDIIIKLDKDNEYREMVEGPA